MTISNKNLVGGESTGEGEGEGEGEFFQLGGMSKVLAGGGNSFDRFIMTCLKHIILTLNEKIAAI